MVHINIYEPGGFDINIAFPSCWNDLTTAELHFIAKVLLAQTDENAIETRAIILKFVFESRLKEIRESIPKQLFHLLSYDELAVSVMPILEFIFKENELTNLPLPFKIGWRKYHPIPFEEITCGEFEDAEVISFDFLAGNTDKLAELAAVLFRPRKRKKILPYMAYHYKSNSYRNYPVDKMVRKFKKMPPEALYAAFIWYAGSRAQLPKYFRELYNAGKKSGKANPHIFTETIHAGAGPKNGTRNEIRTCKLYEFLFDCNLESIKAAEMEAELNKPR